MTQTEEKPKKTILFLCTHNSARSQIAEALMKKYFGDKYEVFSAGTEPTKPNPFALQVIEEEGISTEGITSKHVNQFLDKKIDLVVTVCDHARETCPVFPYAKQSIHKGFEDPSQFQGTPEEKLQRFKETKEQIKQWLLTQFKE